MLLQSSELTGLLVEASEFVVPALAIVSLPGREEMLPFDVAEVGCADDRSPREGLAGRLVVLEAGKGALAAILIVLDAGNGALAANPKPK